MNYYIIPKTHHNYTLSQFINIINTDTIEEHNSPYISQSAIYYLTNIKTQITQYPFHSYFTNLFNPITYISSIQTDNNKSLLYFELCEIFHVYDILLQSTDITLYLTNNIDIHTTQHITPQNINIVYNLNYHLLYTKFIIENKYNNNIDIIFIEIDTHIHIILFLIIILKTQINGGSCIIKIPHLFYKKIIYFLFVLSGIYDKVYIVQPLISNLSNGHVFIICRWFYLPKHLEFNNTLIQHIYPNTFTNTNTLQNELHNTFTNTNVCVNQTPYTNIPYYFVNKIEEINIIILQQQLDIYNQILHLLIKYDKEKNNIKIELIKHNQRQKYIQWFEKYNKNNI